MLGIPGETVTVLTAAFIENRYGRYIVDPDWGNATETDVPGCLFAPQSTSEDNDGRTAVLVGARLYLPAGTILGSTDRVVIRGATYELDGEPSIWADPFGSGLDGIEAQVRKVEG